MSTSTYECARCHAVCDEEDAVIPAIYPAGVPVIASVVVGHVCAACWEDLGFYDPEEVKE